MIGWVRTFSAIELKWRLKAWFLSVGLDPSLLCDATNYGSLAASNFCFSGSTASLWFCWVNGRGRYGGGPEHSGNSRNCYWIGMAKLEASRHWTNTITETAVLRPPPLTASLIRARSPSSERLPSWFPSAKRNPGDRICYGEWRRREAGQRDDVVQVLGQGSPPGRGSPPFTPQALTGWDRPSRISASQSRFRLE